MATTPWQLRGTLVIACNCDYGCPCNFNARPTQGECEGQWVWHVEQGRFGDVRLDGLTFTVTADWPGAIHEGGGKAVSFVDERADESQLDAIAQLVHGGHGGPWGVFINTYELDGPRPAPFEVELDGFASRIRIGDSVDLELEPIHNPVTGAEVHPGAVLPEGLVCREMSFGTTKTFRVSDGVSYEHPGKYSAVAPFEYAA